MQRASAAFGLLIFLIWIAVLAVGLAYVTAWAMTQRRPQWRLVAWLKERGLEPLPAGADTTTVHTSAEIIPFKRPGLGEKPGG